MKSGVIPHYQLSYHLYGFDLSKKDNTQAIFTNLDKIQTKVSCRPRIYIANTRKVIQDVNQLDTSEDDADMIKRH